VDVLFPLEHAQINAEKYQESATILFNAINSKIIANLDDYKSQVKKLITET
jgi:hypothetical protein